MLELLTDEEIVGYPLSFLLTALDQQPVPRNLSVLEDPGNEKDKFGPLSDPEKKLFMFLIELEQRLEDNYSDDIMIPDPHNSDMEVRLYVTLSELYDDVKIHSNNLVEYRTDFDHQLYVHIRPANDGNLYGCKGACIQCFEDMFDRAQLYHRNTIGDHNRAH